MSHHNCGAAANSPVSATINGIPVTVTAGTTILEAAKGAGIKIPTLCHHPDLRVRASCRICLVEVKGQKRLQTACNNPVNDGDVILTNPPQVRQARRTVLELILADHPQDCLTCVRNNNCELQALASEYQISEFVFGTKKQKLPIEDNNPSIVRDMNKCIKCTRCVEACQEVQQVFAITTANRSGKYTISTAFEKPLAESPCVYCGQCINVCPVGALTEKDDTHKVWAALENPNLHVVVQTAPAVRVALGDDFGLPQGSPVTGQMVAALRRLGFDKVFDTDFTADLTIMEEGSELVKRIKEGGALPMLTSCSPGWITFVETYYPDLLPHLSTCKSPQQMFGALAKTYYAEQAGIAPENIYVVSIMPCTAKKAESERPEMKSSGYRDVDAVLTTRELARMIRMAGLDFAGLPDEEFDVPLGISTGAGVIFGASGGVMEAALRTVYELVTGRDLQDLDFTMVRGLEGIKEAEIDLGVLKVKVAVTNGLKNARILLDKIRKGEANYHFIEIMCCPGGCVGGGGQPIGTDTASRKARIDGTYGIDAAMPIRKSHHNPAIVEIYQKFLGHPLSHKSHELLHTHYHERKV